MPPDSGWEISTVADDEIVAHRCGAAGEPAEVLRLTGLAPGTCHDVEGLAVSTLERPGGALLSRFATTNDVHFGEQRCGSVADLGDLVGYLTGSLTDPASVEDVTAKVTSVLGQLGENLVLSSNAGETPYPELMSRAAVEEIAAIDPAVVLVKGDLTGVGTTAEYEAFLACYEPAFGERLMHVRGNHDASGGERIAAQPTQRVDLPGVTLAVLDTVIEGRDSGQLGTDQLEWLDELAAGADRPVLVFGHHHPWDPSSARRSPTYFGINPDDSEALVAEVARRPRIAGYFAGHTHRNRVRRFAATGDVPYVEVASVKDFPGTWAEYRVFEGGVLQVHRRISSPAALEWSERCRALFWGMYPQYSLGSIADRCFAILPR